MPGRESDVDRSRRLGPIPVRPLLVLALVLGLMVGCSGSNEPAACGPIKTEPLDPNFLIHVLPGATGLHYRTDPPTSGPHQPAPHLARVQQRPLPRPVQVGLLEAGDVLVQYRGLGHADIDRVQKLARGHVVVAPNPDLPRGYPVVATGWIHKRTCTAVDVGALDDFAKQRGGKGPGAP